VSLFDVPPPDIDAARLESLRENQVAESRTLDYKERVPKGDLWEDVTAFANTSGGDLLCGVRERLDANGRRTGEPDAIVGLPGPLTLDQLILGVENALRDVIKPRVTGITYHPIARGEDPPCLLIRVPRSPLGPHMVVQKGVGYFYGREARGNFPLDWGQIRDAFVEAHAAPERLARFRRERVIRLLAGETPIPTVAGAKIIFHALPLAPVDVWATFQTLDVPTQVIDAMAPLGGSPNDWRYNLDGFVVHTARTDLDRQTYSQCFRDGGLEGFGPLDGDERKGGFYCHHVEVAVIRALNNYQRLWRILGVSGPMMMALTVSGIRGAKILTTARMVGPVREETFDQDVALIPELVVQDPHAPADRMLRPLFDLMWNGGGWAKSPWYLSTGERTKE
jgi:hypothetical protein